MGMKEKYLPIGTVVLLKGGKKRAMITGFCSVAQENQDKIYDYSGCVYPEGYLSSNQVCLFDHDQIEKIFFVGFEDEEEKSFKEKLNTIVANLEAESAADAEATTPAPESLSETLEEPVVNTETESLENAEETLIDVPVVGTQETGTETEESGIKPFGE
jgi:hypothetical protein